MDKKIRDILKCSGFPSPTLKDPENLCHYDIKYDTIILFDIKLMYVFLILNLSHHGYSLK